MLDFLTILHTYKINNQMDKLLVFMALGSILMTSCVKREAQNISGYSGADISKEVSVIRDKQTKIAQLDIKTDGEWELYAGPAVDKIDHSKPIAKGNKSGIYTLDVPDSTRYYFQIMTDKGSAILAERHLPMTGGYNYRDLGGYKTTDGKYIKWGKIFRSDDLHNLTDIDLKFLSSIPLISIVDFRSEQEMASAPDKNPSSVKTNYAYSISPGNLMAAVTSDISKLTAEYADTLMMQMNELLVIDSACINQYRKFFALLQDEGNIPLMFHCSAGKDRTGMGAALILFTLGVDEQTIVEDYLASNIYLADKYAKYKSENPALTPLFEVKSQFLQAGLNRIKKDYGSVEEFLTKALDVDIQKMREIYLY